jgi:hypothetical protein
MKLLPLSAVVLAVASAAHAQTLVSYEFTGATTLPVPATSVEAGLTASGITKGNILNVVPNANLLSVGPDGSSSDANSAVTLGYYIQFTVTPAAGKKLDLGALIFKVRRETAATLGWVVRSSVDNFSTTLRTEDIPVISPTFGSVSVPLPAAQFSDLAGPVTFRIYTYQAAAASFADYDDIQLIGRVDSRPSVGVFSAKNVVTTRARLNLTGTAFDDSRVVRVTVNGRAAAGTANWRAAVRLAARVTRVRIVATDDSGANSAPVVLRVRRL